MDLQDYARREGSFGVVRKRCITCSLDPGVREEIEKGRSVAPKPIAFPVIARWLETEHGLKIQPNTLRNHFVAGHHND